MNMPTLHEDNPYESSRHVFVLFSGHNDRAVVSLCRFFASRDLQFAIVCASLSDAISQTDWLVNAVISRIDRALDVSLFKVVLQAVHSIYGTSAQPVYCPTTEFMNQFVLQERAALSQLGWSIPLPNADVYLALTNKAHSQDIVEKLIGLAAPPKLEWTDLHAPCVLKPRKNISDGMIRYPLLCRTEAELQLALKVADSEGWFAQSWINGQSYYLCAYLTADGRHAHFWQQNFLQQPGGKSIVLARTVSNPGIQLAPLMEGLHELGYHGPFMMEVIRDDVGRFYYIEINPRFWGPLQLAVDACPNILCLFACEVGVEINEHTGSASTGSNDEYWYSWQFGAQMDDCRRYPALVHADPPLPLLYLLKRWDVYGKPDTQSLHGRF